MIDGRGRAEVVAPGARSRPGNVSGSRYSSDHISRLTGAYGDGSPGNVGNSGSVCTASPPSAPTVSSSAPRSVRSPQPQSRVVRIACVGMNTPQPRSSPQSCARSGAAISIASPDAPATSTLTSW